METKFGDERLETKVVGGFVANDSLPEGGPLVYHAISGKQSLLHWTYLVEDEIVGW